jgi:hypothetical protein
VKSGRISRALMREYGPDMSMPSRSLAKRASSVSREGSKGFLRLSPSTDFVTI